MSDPIVASAKAAVSGIREALAVGKEIDALGKDIAQLGQADIQARAAMRRKAQVVKGDTIFVSAVEEWRRLKDIYLLRQQLKEEITNNHGRAAWEEIEKIEARMKEERAKNFTEDGQDREKLAMLKWACFAAAFVVTIILWKAGAL